MSAVHDNSESPPPLEPDESGDFFGCLLSLASLLAVFWIITAFSIVPLQLSIRVSPWLGMLVAAIGCWVWVKFYPSGPGMLTGMLCVVGAFANVVSFAESAVCFLLR